jgi:glycosyltransferase involved in cell wall biosynthesis
MISTDSRTEHSDRRCPLTTVIIGRNEEQFIGNTIASVLKATEELPEAEIIFVDSASIDRSVEIASQYPIQILQLRREWKLGVAAGRYTGYRQARGEFVFFIDGDAEADPFWLKKAVEFLRENPAYGAVAGVLDEEYVTPAGVHVGGRKNVFEQDLSSQLTETTRLGGIAMFRNAAMKKAGPVNPHLPTGEDDELCMRIRNAGWKVGRIEGRMAIKYTENRDTLYEVLRRCRTSMYDYGAVVRHASLYGCGWQYIFEMISYIVSFAVVLIGLLLLLPITIYFRVLWLYPIGIVGLALLMVLRKRSIKKAIISIAVRAVSTYRTILSYVRTRPQSIESYPTDAIRIK